MQKFHLMHQVLYLIILIKQFEYQGYADFNFSSIKERGRLINKLKPNLITLSLIYSSQLAF